MRRAIFILLVACSSSKTSGGAQGNADFSFSNNGVVKPADKPIALGSDVTLAVQIHDATTSTKATFDSKSPAILSITGTSSTSFPGQYFVVVHAASEGTGTISVGDGMGKIVDTFDVKVTAIAKVDIPSDVTVNVAHDAAVDVTARSASGDEVYAPNVVTWTVDRPDVVQFWDAIRNKPQESISGTSIDLRGLTVGTATVHGTLGKTMLNVPVTVK